MCDLLEKVFVTVSYILSLCIFFSIHQEKQKNKFKKMSVTIILYKLFCVVTSLGFKKWFKIFIALS